jgi:hypothetical protein
MPRWRVDLIGKKLRHVLSRPPRPRMPSTRRPSCSTLRRPSATSSWRRRSSRTGNKKPRTAGRLTRFFLNEAFSPHALATALPTAQTLYEGYDRRVWLNAASDKLWFGEAADMTAAQTFYAYLTSHKSHSYNTL